MNNSGREGYRKDTRGKKIAGTAKKLKWLQIALRDRDTGRRLLWTASPKTAWSSSYWSSQVSWFTSPSTAWSTSTPFRDPCSHRYWGPCATLQEKGKLTDHSLEQKHKTCLSHFYFKCKAVLSLPGGSSIVLHWELSLWNQSYSNLKSFVKIGAE